MTAAAMKHPLMCPVCRLKYSPVDGCRLVPIHTKPGTAELCPGAQQYHTHDPRGEPTVPPTKTEVNGTEIAETKPERTRGAIVNDPELIAIDRILDILGDLPSDQVRQRVVGYVHVRAQERWAQQAEAV